MLVRAVVCASLALALFNLPSATASNVTVNYPDVKKVQCLRGSGSAFLTEGGKWVSVAHVTKNSLCEIDGLPIDATEEDPLDFSTLKVALKGRGFKINCEGFKSLHWYFAIGFAGGFEWQTMTRHVATFAYASNGLRILIGSPTVIPGMSGGVLLNSEGEAVGTVNAYNSFLGASYSRELKGTSICRASQRRASEGDAKAVASNDPPASPPVRDTLVIFGATPVP